jgi:hypothetical protein
MQSAGDREIARQVREAEARVLQDPTSSTLHQQLLAERDELKSVVVRLQDANAEMQVC